MPQSHSAFPSGIYTGINIMMLGWKKTTRGGKRLKVRKVVNVGQQNVQKKLILL